MTATEPVVYPPPSPEALALLDALGFFTFTVDREEEAAA